MLGAWSTFGVHLMPEDGTAIVVVFPGTLPPSGEAVLAIYRAGAIHTQDGRILPVPFGHEWTALPHPRVKA